MGLSNGLSTIPEEPEEALLDASGAAVSQAAPSAAAESEGIHACETLPAADVEADSREATGSEAPGIIASTSQAIKLPGSAAADAERQPGAAVSSHNAGQAPASQTSAEADSSEQHLAAIPFSCSSESLVHAERVVAKQLVPLPVLTALEISPVSRKDPHALLSAAMHAAHAVPKVHNASPTTASSHKDAETAMSQPDRMTIPIEAERSAARKASHQSASAAPPPSISHIRAAHGPPGQSSRAVSATSPQVRQISFMSTPRPETFAGDSVVSRPIAAAAIQTTAALGRRAMQTALPNQALKRKHIAASVPALYTRRPTADAIRPVLTALELLLDADSIKISGHIPGK